MGIHKPWPEDHIGRKIIGFPKWYYNTIIRKPYMWLKEKLTYEYTP